MNTKQVNEMISAAKNNQTFLMEVLWTHFLPHYVYVLDLIRSKTLGEVKSLTTGFGFISPFHSESRLYTKKLGGGSLLDIGIYPLFAVLTIIGYPNNIEANATINQNGID